MNAKVVTQQCRIRERWPLLILIFFALNFLLCATPSHANLLNLTKKAPTTQESETKKEQSPVNATEKKDLRTTIEQLETKIKLAKANISNAFRPLDGLKRQNPRYAPITQESRLLPEIAKVRNDLDNRIKILAEIESDEFQLEATTHNASARLIALSEAASALQSNSLHSSGEDGRLNIEQLSIDQLKLEALTLEQRLITLHLEHKDVLTLHNKERRAIINKQIQHIKRRQMDLNSAMLANAHDVALEEETLAITMQKDNENLEPQIVAELQTNIELSSRLKQLTHNNRDILRNLFNIRSENSKLDQLLSDTYKTLKVQKIGKHLASYLRDRKRGLLNNINSHENHTNYTSIKNESMSLKYIVDDQFRLLSSPESIDQIINNILSTTQEDTEKDKLTAVLNETLHSRKVIVDKLVTSNTHLLSNLLLLEAERNLLSNKHNYFNKLLDQHLLFENTSAQAHTSLEQTLELALNEYQQSWQQHLSLFSESIKSTISIILTGFALAYLIHIRSRSIIQHRLARIGTNIGNVTKDKWKYTAEAIAITLLYSLPIPLIFLALAVTSYIQTDAYLAEAIAKFSVYLFCILFMHYANKLTRLTSLHFRWNEMSTNAFITSLPLLLIFAILQCVVDISSDNSSDLVAHTIIRTLIIVQMLLLTAIAVRLSASLRHLRSRKNHWFSRAWFLSSVIRPILICGPLVIAMITWNGHVYISVVISEHIIDTLIITGILFIVHQSLVRWLFIEERRLSYNRAVAKRESLQVMKSNKQAFDSQTKASTTTNDFRQIDMATVTSHNRGLSQSIIALLWCAFTWTIWRDITPALNFLNTIEFWSYTTEISGETSVGVVTLYDLLIAFSILLVTIISSRNMPGFIETIVLKRLPMDSGVRFAVTRISRYIIGLMGLYFSLSYLHLSTDSIGWLIAAMGVGLGFGLQEIFANFVAGLIILFERPIRIGDLVSINDITGIVTNIKMRATTITDYDRVETLIPNKAVVTNQMMNWTLSDGITRVVITVDVGRDSDADTVKTLLIDAAHSIPSVMTEPAPDAIFMAFSEHALTFELRAFVDDHSLRLSTRDMLHHTVNRALRKANISIAHPQLDLHVRSLPNETTTVSTNGKTT